ncbi:MAG: hypothetical protein LKE41_09110 [Prevotella sp.]|jgi:hypothetical protein|nr:hypothetical protein [Prevotella sp.]
MKCQLIQYNTVQNRKDLGLFFFKWILANSIFPSTLLLFSQKHYLCRENENHLPSMDIWQWVNSSSNETRSSNSISKRTAMKQLLKSICTYQRSPMTTNSNGTGAQNALTVTSQMTFHMQMGGGIYKEGI